jgi:hypothetical protein
MAERKEQSKARARPITYDKAVSFKISSDLHERAVQKSARTGISISFVVRRALEKWVSGGDA